MPDTFIVDGWLVAETSIPDSWPLANTQRGGRLLLFRSERGWILFTLTQLTTCRDQEPVGGFATGTFRSFADLAALQAALGNTPMWQPLLAGGAERSAELRARLREEER